MAPVRLAALWVAAALLALAVGAAAQAPAAGCRLPLYLNASASTLSLAGSSVDKPVSFSLTPAFPDAQVGLEGALTLALPGGGPCPTDAAGLAAQLAGATLQPSDAAGPLLLYPTSQIVLNGGTFVTLTLQGNQLNVSSSPLAAGGSGGFTTDLTGLIVEGTVLSNSSFTGVETLSMVGINATNASAVAVATQGSTTTLTLPVYWVMRSVYQNAKIGSEGVSLYHFSGQIVAQTTFGCPADCGPNGRCTSAPDGTAACACECGWAGAACDVPSGFCSSFPAELSGAAVCPVAPTPAPAPPPEAAPCRPLQDCSITQQFNAASGACSCRQGWSGPGTCSACQTGAACDALFNTSGATCSSEVAFQQGMPFKAFTCDLAGTGLEETIEPGSFYMVCNTSAAAGEPSLASSAEQYCKVNFALKGKGANPVTCTATECGFRANSTRVDCATTECACLTDCPDVQGILNTINGKPCSIDCDAQGNCKFDIQDFFVTLVAPCQTAACVVPGFTFVEGDYTIPESQSYDPVIAAVPLMALVGLAGFLSLYLIRHRLLFANGTRGAATAAAVLATADGAPAPRRRPSDPVHLLTFDDLSCAVLVRRRFQWLRRLFACGRSSAAPAAQDVGVTAAVAVGGGVADVPGYKQIVKGASGVAANGELVGVLGPSGSGKTTLLAIVAGSAEDLDKRSVLTGSVLMDGQPIHSALRRKIGYVAQDDTLLPTLTVEECVRYSAVLRLHGADAAEIQAAVHSVLAELGLSHVARSQVGGRSGIRGISGGERRRVTIAMELVTEPAVLVLDEPTSGLDSFTALNLMRTMKQVASGGRIVMLSFHQPSPAMFSLLDRAYLMAQGYCIFSGPPAAAESWFAQRGLPCPVGTAIAEHMLDSVSDPATLGQLLAAHSKERAAAAGYANGSAGASTAARRSADELMPVSLAASSAFEESNGKLVGDSLSKSATPSLRGEALATEQAQQAQQAQRADHSISRELAVVFWRTLIDIWRNPLLLALHWVLALLMGAFVGAVFFDVSFDVSGAQNRVGAMFFVLCFFAFTSLTTVDLFQMERKMVVREVRGGYYRPATYLLAKMVLDALLLRVIPVFIFSAPFYPMMGLQSSSAVVATFLFVVSTFAAAMGAMSLAVTVGSSSAGTASLIMNIVLLIGVVVSGMLVNPESMKAWIRWTHWISIFFYSYSSMMINEMSAIKIDFELQGYAAASNVRGTVFLETIGIDASNLTLYIIICDVFWAGLVALAFVILYIVMPRPRSLAHALPSRSPPASK